jgi:hypothetical protein
MTKFETRINVRIPNDRMTKRKSYPCAATDRAVFFVSSLEHSSFEFDSNFEFRHSNLAAYSISDFPVISSGFSNPIIASAVGATSASRPSVRSFLPLKRSSTTMISTG